MPSILVELDEAIYRRLSQIAPQRNEFVRKAIEQAIRKHDYRHIREGYRRDPDSAAEADDWSNCEEFEL